MKDCLNCGKSFKKWGSLKKWCSSNCASIFWRKENAQKRTDSIRKYNASDKGYIVRRRYYLANKDKPNEYRKAHKPENNARTRAKYAMKKAGIEKICFECQSLVRIHVHHIDKNVFNNHISNLVYLCSLCHGLRHRTT